VSINQRVKQVRRELKLPQSKFAEALSISNGYVAGIELERKTVNARFRKLLCLTFQVDEHWLLTGEGNMFQTIRNPVAESVISKFKRLCSEYQELILTQISMLLDIQEKNDSCKLNQNRGENE